MLCAKFFTNILLSGLVPVGIRLLCMLPTVGNTNKNQDAKHCCYADERCEQDFHAAPRTDDFDQFNCRSFEWVAKQ